MNDDDNLSDFRALLADFEQKARAAERMSVVTYLLLWTEIYDDTAYGAQVLHRIARNIEAGKHREGEDD